MAITKIGNNAIPSGAVTQHVTATDLQPIKSDISALALREATNESSAAFNLPNQFIDTFSDDTNLGTQTTVDRTSGYISTNYTTYGSEVIFPWNTIDVNTTTTGWAGNLSDVVVSGSNHADDWFDTDGQNRDAGNTHNGGSGGTVEYDFNATYRFTALLLGKRQQHGDFNTFTIEYSANGSSWTGMNFTGWSATHTGNGNYQTGDGSYYHSGSAPSGTGLIEALNSDGTGNWYQFGVQNGYENSVKQKVTGFTPLETRYLKITLHNQHSGAANTNASLASFAPYYTPVTSTFGATGTLIQSANAVGSAKTKVGGTALYKDVSGTATLGTDLKIYFTCNGGSNWTEASSYSAITPVYSTGIKQVRLGETTCTSGTDIRYKAVWANQASGSKETQLHGIGVNY